VDDLESVFEEVSSYFSVMSEPTRLKILHAICQEEKAVNAIVEEVGATQTNVSRHLTLMYRAGVVSRRKDGNQVFYRVVDPSMMEICRTVCNQIAGRLDNHEPLRRGLVKLAAARRRRAA
jgi:DNA-binding transcriptional ArsR family regulator